MSGSPRTPNDGDCNFKTTYYVVFGIDENVYQQQLAAAMDDVDDNDESTSFLQGEESKEGKV